MKLLIDEDTLNIVLDALRTAEFIATDTEDAQMFDTLSIRLAKEIREAKENAHGNELHDFDLADIFPNKEAIEAYLADALRRDDKYAVFVARAASLRLRLNDNRNKITGTN